jgi:hypothetical protein
MPSVILAGTTTGTALSLTSDTSGELQIRTNNGSTTAMTLTTGGDIGIGTSSPASKLDVYGEIRTTLSSNTAYYGAFNNNNGAVQVYANGDSAPLVFGTTSVGGSTATERMRIDSAGNVGIGTSSPANPLEVTQASTPTVAGLKVSGPVWTMLDINTTSTDSGARNWRLAGVLNAFGRFEIVSGSTQGGAPDTTVFGVSRGSSIALQGATPQTGTGITFPATQSASSDANTLDDYEEGIFTPDARGSTSAGTGTYTIRTGRYRKIGSLVYAQITIGWSAHTGTGALHIGNLPFTPISGAEGQSAVSIGYTAALNWTASNQVMAYVSAGNTYMVFVSSSNSGGITAVPMDSVVDELILGVTYVAA